MAGPKEHKHRRRRIVAAVAIVVAIAVVIVLSRVASTVKGIAETKLAEELGGTATIEELSISLLGTVRVRDVSVTDEARGESILSVALVEVEPHIVPLLRGQIHFDASIERPVIRLREGSEGEWSVGKPREKGGADDEDEREPLELFGTVRVTGGELDVIGHEAQTTIDELEATLTFAGRIDQPAGNLAFGIASASGERGRATVNLVADRDSDPRTPDGQLEVVLDGMPLSVIDAFLAPDEAAQASTEDEPRPAYTFTAPVGGTLVLVGAPAKFNCSVELSSTDLRVAVDGRDALHEPAVLVTMFAVVSTRRLDVKDFELELVAGALSGTINGRVQNLRGWLDDEPESPALFEGVTAAMKYRPEALNPLVAPWFPESIDSISKRRAGPDQERIDVDFPGPLTLASGDALLPALRGTAKIGVGRVETEMLDGEGGVELTFGEGALDWVASFDTGDGGDGGVVMSGTLDPANLDADRAASAGKPTKVSLRADQVEATSRLSPLLAHVHPAFATLHSIDASSIAGRIVAQLELSYGGALSPEVFSGGLDTFPVERLAGTGSLEITGAALRGAPVLDEMLRALGVDADEDLHVRPIRFAIANGRLEYLNPWTWTIGEETTTFTGSVGFDNTLDLTWNLPVTDALVGKYGFLKAVRGKTIGLPIAGTVTSPKLDWRAPLADLGQELTGERLLQELGLGKLTQKGEGDAEDPAALFDRANRLWDEGKKVEAAELYRKIRSDHGISLTYALNRDRIKKRAKYEE